MELIDLVQTLTGSVGVSGAEEPAAKTAAALLSQYAEAIETTPMGSVTAVVKEGSPMILLDAHLDEIGLIVTYLGENGFLKVAPVGGVDRRLLIAQEVTILSSPAIDGVVASKPPHLQDADESKKVPKIDDLWIDTGLNGEELKKVVSPGDRVILKSKFQRLLNDRIASKSLDDRAGVAVLLRALELVKDKSLSCGIAVSFSSQEELGCLGAKTSAYCLSPDLSISVDVSFAHTPDTPEHKCGKLGEGPMIGIAPVLDRKMSEAFISLAKKREIPYQIEVMSGTTSTNADSIQISRGGVRCGLLSVPLRYMHTPVETIALSDVENTARLIAAFLEKEGI